MASKAINLQNINPPLNPAFQENTSVTAKGTSARRQFAWLERSKSWPELPQIEWQAQKVLGLGSYAITGLFSYIGNDPITPRHLVKQSNASTATALRVESKILHLTTGTDTNHIVRLYKGFHRAGGTGTGENDPLPYDQTGAYNQNLEVVRIYLEYAQGGDAQALLDQIGRNKNYVIPEEHLWRILDCLARACLVLGKLLNSHHRVVRV